MTRLPVGFKLLWLTLWGILAYVLHDIWILLAMLLVSVLVLVLAKPGLRKLRKSLLGLVILAGVIFGVNLIFKGPLSATASTLRLFILMLAALAFTYSTSFDRLLEGFLRWLKPLRLLGLDVGRVSLILALTLRFIPEIVKLHAEVREAQKARGLERRPLALMLPLMVRVLETAPHIGAALLARGYEGRGVADRMASSGRKK